MLCRVAQLDLRNKPNVFIVCYLCGYRIFSCMFLYRSNAQVLTSLSNWAGTELTHEEESFLLGHIVAVKPLSAGYVNPCALMAGKAEDLLNNRCSGPTPTPPTSCLLL